MNKAQAVAGVLVGGALLAGCATPARVTLPEPVRQPKPDTALTGGQALVVGGTDSSGRPAGLERFATPAPPGTQSAVAGINAETPLPPLRGQPINVNIEGMPVPAFINEFFGTILGAGFQMDPNVARMSDLITLRTSGPQSPQNFYRLATRVLQTYGVATAYQDGIVVFTQGAKGQSFEPPLILSGRALPDVPISHRPVFQLVELNTVRISDVDQWLTSAFANSGLQIQPDLNRNAIVLFGKRDIVEQAVAAIRVLDRPFMRGRVSARLEPGFVSADELARRLVDVLVAEGYGASLHGSQGGVQAAAVVVLSIAASNTVVIFAGERSALEHAVDWARSIDQPNPTAGNDSLFYYTVRNTKASEIVETLNGIRSQSTTRDPARQASSSLSPVPAVASPGAAANAPVAPVGQGNVAGSLAAGLLLLDAPRNALIYQGKASDWARVLPLIRQMDQSPRQVMVEVTIAEVSLDATEEFGVSWLAKNDIGRFNGRVSSGTLGGAVGASSGLTYILDIAGQTRAQLRAFADANRLTVLSTPRLMVKSGEEASFDVGTEIPTLSTQTASNQQVEGTSNILQSIQYRKTGIILNIKPTVYSDNRVDLEIRQEVSEALPIGSDAAVQSPSIFNRAVSTSLSLRDGSSVLIGGLMSQRRSQGNGGVPYLKDVPLVGNLFKSSSRSGNKTELVLMIVPYIVDSDEQATSLTRTITDRFQMLELPTVADPTPVVPSSPVRAGGGVPVRPR